MEYLSPARTAELLPFKPLLAELAQAALDYEAGRLSCPPRMVVKAPVGAGALLCMPATAPDVMITKLLTAFPPQQGRPALQGVVTVCDGSTGQFLFGLDGPTLTARRTAALSLLAFSHLSPESFAEGASPTVLLIGTGAQARGHLEALQALLPKARIFLRGRRPEAVRALCAERQAAGQNVVPDLGEKQHVAAVITVTGSKTPIYGAADPVSTSLIVAVGAFQPEMVEIAPELVQGSQLFVDDPAGAESEAGDYLQAGVDLQKVRSLVELVSRDTQALASQVPTKPVIFKSVGCGAWDIAAARLARKGLEEKH